MSLRSVSSLVFVLAALFLFPVHVFSQGEVLEFYCQSCGYRAQFIQGSDASDVAKNVQHIVVVCERTGQIRNVKIPLDPTVEVINEPLTAKPLGSGNSRLLGIRLPKFVVPGNTCPLYPVAAYLDANICPVDGQPGFQATIIGTY